MSRSPWLWFALVGLVPAALLGGNVLGGSIALAALFPALAAMLALSSGDQPQPLPEYLARRLLVAIGVVAILVGARLAWTGLDGLAYRLIVAAVPAALAAWVLSGMYAPSPAVRRWVRSLVATGAPRRVLPVAVLAWPLVGAASVVVCAALPGLTVAAPRAASVGLLAATIVNGVFAAALVALGWYGYAGRRLLPGLNPLVTGLLIGVLQWLVVWGPALRPATALAPFFLFRLIGFAAAGVVGMWVYGRSRGSLLPVWLLGVSLALSQTVTYLSVTPQVVGRTDTLPALYAAGQATVALVLAVLGRMWRQPQDVSRPGSPR